MKKNRLSLIVNIHPLIDIRLLEKTEKDRDISFPRRLIEFAENQKENPEIAFDEERDKMIVVFDGDIFEEKVLDYDDLIAEGEKNNILAVSNPAFELFMLLHYENSYEDDIEPKLTENPNVCKISMFALKDTKQIHHEALFQLALKNNIGGKIGEIANNVLDGVSKL